MRETSIWIWGRHAVIEALRAKTALSIWIAAGRQPSPSLREVRALAAQGGVPLSEVPLSELDRLAPGQQTQGVAAKVRERRLEDLAELVGIAQAKPRPAFLLVLDQIQDPHNLGALLRTANAAGVQGVILPERRSAHVSGIVAKTSAGAVSHVPVLEAVNLARALVEIRQANIWIVGLDGTAKDTIFSSDLTMPLALVVGSEGSGLRRLTRERCDFLVRLPMRGAVESLNASVAGSIAMYEAVRQRLIAETA